MMVEFARGRRVLCAIVVSTAAIALTAQERAAVEWRTVAPGVEHAAFVRGFDDTGRAVGPWNINLLRVDLSQVRLDVVHAMDEAVGLETVSSIAARLGAIAAVNGGYFRTNGTYRGDPAGTLQIDGDIWSEPDRGRAAVGFIRSGRATRLVFGHVAWDATLDAGGVKQRVNGLNRPRARNELIVFTPAFHRTTLTNPDGIEIVVRSGRVAAVRENAGSTTIPSDGFVVSASGSARQWARDHLRPGTEARFSAALRPVTAGAENSWTAAEDIVGGGPKLVTDGRTNITLEREGISPAFSTEVHPRTAIALLKDGRALFLAVDGRQPPLRVGMSLDALAKLLIELGAVDAVNLDGGGSTTMVVQGKLVTHPSDAAGERPVSDAIVLTPAR